MADEVITCSFEWEIENYYFGFPNGVKSSIFTPDNFGGSKWYLEFKQCSIRFRPNSKVNTCSLCRTDDDTGDEEVPVRFTIKLENGKGSYFSDLEEEKLYKIFKRGDSKHELLQKRACPKDQKKVPLNKKNITISCQMFTRRKPPKCVAQTKIGMDTTCFTWKLEIPHNDSLSQKRIFSFAEELQYEISINAPPNNGIDIRIIKRNTNSSLPAILIGKISLLNLKNEKVLPKEGEHLFDFADGNEVWKFPFLISKKRLLDKNCLSNNTFSMFFEFSVPNGTHSSDIFSFNHNPNKLKNVAALHDDLVNLWRNMENADVQLQTENRISSAHKNVLAARSPVFRAMFNRDMLEKETNKVDISDVDYKTLRTFLEFIYTGAVDIEDSEDAFKLLEVADKYEVLSLKRSCTEYLSSSLSLENACKMLQIANQRDLKLLKRQAIDYVAVNFSVISKLDEWSEFIERDASLMNEFHAHMAAEFEIIPKKKRKRRKEFGSIIAQLFKERRAQSVPIQVLRDYVSQQEAEDPFTPEELNAALDTMIDVNQLMIANEIVFLI